MATHPQYADAAPYVGKFRALQQRAMGSMRSRVQSVLRKAIEQVSVLVSGRAEYSACSPKDCSKRRQRTCFATLLARRASVPDVLTLFSYVTYQYSS